MPERLLLNPGLELLDSPPYEIVEFVQRKLREHAQAAGAPVTPGSFAVLKRDEQGDIIGGLQANRYWDWMFIDLLWVADGWRGQGIGSALLAAAEDKARLWPCNGIYLFSNSWQAPAFYRKHGYEQFGVLDDYPKGFQRFCFMKRIVS